MWANRSRASTASGRWDISLRMSLRGLNSGMILDL